jgi:hypothetical protein
LELIQYFCSPNFQCLEKRVEKWDVSAIKQARNWQVYRALTLYKLFLPTFFKVDVDMPLRYPYLTIDGPTEVGIEQSGWQVYRRYAVGGSAEVASLAVECAWPCWLSDDVSQLDICYPSLNILLTA